jgi:hypothetical protein
MQEVKLTRGYIAIVDDEDFELVLKYSWYPLISRRSKTVYAKSKQILMHRLIMRVHQREEEVCHIDGNGLHNWRSNLIVASHKINMQLHGLTITHCPKGHSYSEDNIYYNITTGGRRCRICHKTKVMEAYWRKQKED